jgi:hypothetical protein
MNPNDLPDDAMATAEMLAVDGASLLSPLLSGATRGGTSGEPGLLHGVVVGELLALTDDGTTPLVRFPGQVGESAIAARSSVDLHGPHIGQGVVLVFEQGDPARPIVVGVLRGASAWPLADKPAQVDVDADGQRLIVSAKEQLVLRCGKASITLTQAGKVLIDGAYVQTRSSGVNRIKGGSVQLN